MKKNISGFSLLEVIITVAIVAILASIALPSLQDFISSNRIDSVNNRFYMALSYARSEAIKRGSNVTVCVSNAAQTACDASLNDYAKGWIIFTGDFPLDPAETILQVSGAVSDQLTIENAGAFEDSITFRSTGQATAALVPPNDRFYINKAGDAYTNVIVTVTGRVRSCHVSVHTPNAAC